MHSCSSLNFSIQFMHRYPRTCYTTHVSALNVFTRVRSWQEHLPVTEKDMKVIYQAVKQYNAASLIIFSSALPCDFNWEQTHELHIAFNRFLRYFSREKHFGFMPTYSPFIHKAGVKKGILLSGLFMVRDIGQHLNHIGRNVFADSFKMALSQRQLFQMAVAAGFRYWCGVGEWCI